MKDKVSKLEDYELLWEYVDSFLEKVWRLPPKREIYFTVSLVLGEALVSKDPYMMTTLELMELKM